LQIYFASKKLKMQESIIAVMVWGSTP